MSACSFQRFSSRQCLSTFSASFAAVLVLMSGFSPRALMYGSYSGRPSLAVSFSIGPENSLNVGSGMASSFRRNSMEAQWTVLVGSLLPRYQAFVQ